MWQKAYLRYAEQVAEGAIALHTLELALTKACKALPDVYRMIIPVTLGYDFGYGAIDSSDVADKAEALLVPVFSQLPLLLSKVREAGEYTVMAVREKVDCPHEDAPGIAIFVRENTRLPQVLELEKSGMMNFGMPPTSKAKPARGRESLSAPNFYGRRQ